MSETVAAPPEVVELTGSSAISVEEFDLVPLVGFNLSGTLPPLFAVRTWSEEVEGYRLLAKHLGSDQPIYSVSPPVGSKAADFPADSNEWADLCIERFGSLLDRKRIALTGWSFAGVVALRVAERLAERGVDVRLVALVDSTLPRRKPRGDSRKRSEVHHFFVMMERMFELEDSVARRLYFVRYAKKVPRRMAKRVWRKWKVVRRALHREPEFPADSSGANSEASSIRNKKAREGRIPLLMRAVRVAYLKHQATVTSIPVSLYWSEDSRARVGDAGLGWPRFLRGDFESRPLPGSHHTLYEEPHVQTLARRLSESLKRAWDDEAGDCAPRPPSETTAPGTGADDPIRTDDLPRASPATSVS